MTSHHDRKQNSTSIIDQARELASLGFRIVKLKPLAKQPAGTGWQERATDNPAQIDWSGDCNIGVMGGSRLSDGNRLLILDIDVKNRTQGNRSLNSLQETYRPLPRTATALTPSGGKHFYYKVPADTPLASIREILNRLGYGGIDLIGEGLFAVAPPSTLPHGEYRWETSPAEIIAPIPTWLLHLLKLGGMPAKASSLASVALDKPRKPKSRQKTEERLPRKRKRHDGPLSSETVSPPAHGSLLSEMIERFPVTGPGQRNNRMHKAVASLFAKRLDAPTVETVMTLWHEYFAEKFSTDLPQALDLLRACITSTLKKIREGRFTLCKQANHFQQCLNWTLPSFQGAFRCRRCLIPADGFYEWKKEGSRKQPVYIRRKDGQPFAFAGLWEEWERGGEMIESCVIITTEANELMAEYHDRMPVILHPKDYDLWLDLEVHDPRLLEPLLKPFPSDDLEVYPVSRLVNDPKNEDPKCIEKNVE